MVKIKIYSGSNLLDSTLISKSDIEFYFVKNAIKYLFEGSKYKKNIISSYNTHLSDLAIKDPMKNKTTRNLYYWLKNCFPLCENKDRILIQVQRNEYESYKVYI